MPGAFHTLITSFNPPNIVVSSTAEVHEDVTHEEASDVAEFTRPGWLSWKDTNLDGKDSFLWRRRPEAVNETKPQTRKITIK